MELKFAVVREDPAIEAALVRRLDARSVLTVASGGCTILSLATDLPEVAVTAFDLSPVQLAHVTAKAAALSRGDAAALNVGDPNPYGLNQHGAFEKLFRVLRTYVSELVVAPGELDRYFAEPLGAPALARSWLASRYWPAAFETAFNEPFLHAMFGPDATQHAEPGSYPGYFRRAFERGLLREDGPENPFLAHVFLGEYRGRAVPDYLRGLGAVHPAPALVQGGLEQVPALERFDLFSLSNIFDWSDDALVARWGRLLSQTARPGAAVLLRQLNNRRDLRRWFPAFRFDDDLGQELLARDRSLFYEKIEVGFRAP